MSLLIIDSPFPHGMGKFEWFALGNNKTLVTLTHWNDLDVTKGFLITTLLKAMPEIKTGIPYGANTFALEALNEKFNGKAKGSVHGLQMDAPQLERQHRHTGCGRAP